MTRDNVLISFVIPVFNEKAGLVKFNSSLLKVAENTAKSFEIIYCEDGSTDETAAIIKKLSKNDKRIKLLKLSRNFGKEVALSAGISSAQGKAIIMLDGDGQHPVKLIPQFVKSWENGNKVVIGVRKGAAGSGVVKRVGSPVFYKLFNKITGQTMVPGSTDFRLIDRSVQKAFIKLNEDNRLTRGLIDWIGFKRDYVYFDPGKRISGEAVYSTRALMKLAANSFVSLSPKPLYIFGYLGVLITSLAFLLGLSVLIEQLILNDPLHWKFTGTAMLGILTIFLVGIILMSQGILSVYISHIHSLSKGRPLYIIDEDESIGIN